MKRYILTDSKNNTYCIKAKDERDAVKKFRDFKLKDFDDRVVNEIVNLMVEFSKWYDKLRKENDKNSYDPKLGRVKGEANKRYQEMLRNKLDELEKRFKNIISTNNFLKSIFEKRSIQELLCFKNREGKVEPNTYYIYNVLNINEYFFDFNATKRRLYDIINDASAKRRAVVEKNKQIWQSKIGKLLGGIKYENTIWRDDNAIDGKGIYILYFRLDQTAEKAFELLKNNGIKGVKRYYKEISIPVEFDVTPRL